MFGSVFNTYHGISILGSVYFAAKMAAAKGLVETT